MSNSALVTYTRLSPNCTKPRAHAIDTVTIHCVVGQLTAEEICNLGQFTSYDAINGASCNYAVGRDGSIGLCVEEANRSWCTDSRSNDHRAITIEVACDETHPYAVTEKAYNALLELLADICRRNGIQQLLWKGDKTLVGQVDRQNMTVHRWFANKACPGEYLYSRHGEIAAEVNRRLAASRLDNTPALAHKKGVEWALEQGILTGNAEGDLMLSAPLTRQQFCTMLFRYEQKQLGSE